MRFQQTITSKDGTNPTGTEQVTIVFNASTWAAAAKYGDTHQRLMGMDSPSYSSAITYYNDPKPRPLGELLAEDEERKAFEAANPKPSTIDALRLVRMSMGWQYMSAETRAIIDDALSAADAS